MKGLDRPETTSRQLMKVTQLGSILIPIAVLLYLLVAFSQIAGDLQVVDQPLVLLAALAWVVLGLLIAQEKARYKFQTIRWLGAYHIIMALFLLFVTGFSEPIIYLWSLLFITSFVYFGILGLTASVTLLIVTGIIDGLLLDVGSIHIGENLVYSLIVIIIGGITVGIISGANTDQERIDNAREQAELQHQRLMTLVNNLAEAIINLDTHGKIMLYNAAALNLLDTNTSIDGKYIDEVFSFTSSDNKPVKLSHELKSIRAVTVRDDLHTNISEEDIRIELTISPIRTGYSASNKKAGWIVIMRDITTAKSLEEERDEFISVVSHELRTPIAVTEGTISNVQLMMERGTMNKAVLKPAVDMAHEQIMFLAKMVNDLSTLSRAERGVADSTEDIDVDDLIHRIYKEYEPEATAKGIQLNLHMPAKCGTVQASRLYLKELLQNFVTNAIKYTREGTVTIDVKRSQKDTVRFSVTDTGIGISKSDQKRIFDKFYRAEDYRTRETSGTGLGLYVSVKLAKKLGTQIEMKSRLNHGSTFSIVMSASKK